MIGSLPDETTASGFQRPFMPTKAPRQVLKRLSMVTWKQ